MKENTKKALEPLDAEALLQILKMRFEENTNRHKDLDWNAIHNKLLANPEKLWSLQQMEKTGGEPDVVGYDKTTDDYLFLIVVRKVRAAAEAAVLTATGSCHAKNTNPKPMPSTWPRQWALRC